MKTTVLTIISLAACVEATNLFAGITVITPTSNYGMLDSEDRLHPPSISASVDPLGEAGTIVFEWGTNADYTDSIVITNLPAGAPTTIVQASLAGLPGNIDYHYSFVAQTASSTTSTPDQVFHVPDFVTLLSINDTTNQIVGANFTPEIGAVMLADFCHEGVMDIFYHGYYQPPDDTDIEIGCQLVMNNLTRYYGQSNPGTLSLATGPGVMPAFMAGVGPTDGLTTLDDLNNDGLFDLLQGGIINPAVLAPVGQPTSLLAGTLPLTNVFAKGSGVTNIPLCPTYYNSVINFGASLPSLGYSYWQFDGAVADFNGDGRPDVIFYPGGLYALSLNQGQAHAGIFPVGQGADAVSFVTISSNLSSSGFPTPPAVAVGDYDNDGFMDMWTSGSGLCHNDGYGNLTATGALPGVLYGSAAWGDYDNDGYLDIAIGGSGGITIYHNNGNGTFTATANIYSGRYLNGIAWGDMNNDGLLDLVASFDGSSNVQVFLNQGSNVFTALPSTNLAPQLYESVYDPDISPYGDSHGLALGDLNNDGRLDIVVTGADPNGNPGLGISINNLGPTNQPPSAPTGLSSVTAPGQVTLHWGSATDDITPSLGLSYNIRVGTTSHGIDIVSPLADPTNGMRYVPRLGNKQESHMATLRLAPGTYYWSVQAIDGAYAGGPWAPEQTFTVSGASVPYIYSVSTPQVTSSSASVTVVAMTGYESNTLTWIEYGATTNYGCVGTPVATGPYPLIAVPGPDIQPESVPSDSPSDVNSLQVTLSSLQAATTYHMNVVISNSAGVVQGQDMVFTTLPELTIASPNTPVQGSSSNYPAWGAPGNAMDGDAATAYINYDQFNTGFSFAAQGGAPVRSLTLISATNNPGSDPAAFLIYGSEDGTNYTLFTGGDVPAFPARSSIQNFNFTNTTEWNYYMIQFPVVQTAGPNVPMQIAEAELMAWQEITTPNDSLALSYVLTYSTDGVPWNDIIPPPTNLTSASALLDHELGATSNALFITNNAYVIDVTNGDPNTGLLNISPVTYPDEVIVDMIPAQGWSILKGIQVFSANDSDNNAQAFPTSVAVYGADYSTNGWNFLGSFQLTQPTTAMQSQTLAMINSNSYSQYRFSFGGQSSGTNWELGELRLFGQLVAPTLGISAATNQVTLTWPNAPGYELEYSTNLAGNIWLTNSSSPIYINGTNSLTLPIDAASKFFRLCKP